MSVSKKNIIAPKVIRKVSASEAPNLSRGVADLTLSFEEIQTLISLIGRESIDELQLEVGAVKLHIRKAVGNSTTSSFTQVMPYSNTTAITKHIVSDDEPSLGQLSDPDVRYITSPIVGTFYRAPSVNASIFVQKGDLVKLGQTLCIVEAMKLMNEIECDIAGELVEVMVEDGQPVEYGERLFAIRVC
jgi:acetyl-CoA carboxylase biotin carboxyl carrier protein